MNVSKHRALALFTVLALAACSGKDGAIGQKGDPGQDGTDGTNGINGINGTNGVDGANALSADVESCAVCHATSRDFDFTVKHASTNKVVVGNAAAAKATNGTDIEVTFNVKVDGVNNDTFVVSSTPTVYRHAYVAAREGTSYTSGAVTYPVKNAFERFSVPACSATVTTNCYTIASKGSGNYTATLVGMVAVAGTANNSYLVTLRGPTGTTWYATAVAGTPALARDLVGNDACMNCHGNNVFFDSASHHGANPQGVTACVFCHVRYDSTGRDVTGTRLTAYVHGIHNSHNMPARDITGTVNFALSGQPADNRTMTVTKPAGTYARNDSLAVLDRTAGTAKISSPFSIGFPGYMMNCSTCHDSDTRLRAVLDAPVSWSTCISCHDSFDGFPKTKKGEIADFHQPYTAATDCTVCHNSTTMPGFYKAEQFHNGLMTERAGLIWAGKDQSIEEGKKITVEVTNVAVADGKYVIQWKAYNALAGNAAYDPCNKAVASGPVFMDAAADAATGQVASNFDVLRAYAQGNDWVNAGMGSSPGQPGSTTAISSKNTTCDANKVATTTITADKTSATKGIVALQGKPQVKFAAANKVIQVRARSATREFVVATGAAPSASQKRRQVVSIDKCMNCHLGSVYQHGGNRVDNTELCVMCHNPAANEKNNRVTLGVDATTAYDGKSGETYDFRYMIHAIHSAGEGAPFVIYRTRGIYAWGSQAALDALPNWPTEAVSCQLATPNSEGQTETVAFKVYGSKAYGTKPENDANGFCKSPLPAATDGAYLPHAKTVVHYPRALNDCAACHVNDADKQIPDPTRSVPVAVDAGAAPWNGLLDDTLMGPVAATCMSCHQSSVKGEQSAIRAHAYMNGWVPQVFPNGIQTLLDAASK